MPLLKLGLLRAVRVTASIAIVCAIMAVEFHFHGLRNTTVTYSLLLAILFFAVRWDRLETIVASLVAALGFLKYFQLPIGSLKATDPQSYVAVAAFLITAIVVSQTALAARRRAAEALERERETERLYELGQAMLARESSPISDEALRVAAIARTPNNDPSRALALIPVQIGEELMGGLGVSGAA